MLMDEEAPDRATATPLRADVVVIGAGLGGTAAATILARAGHEVVLIDSHAVLPQEFRAERLGTPHAELLDRLGLTATMLASATPTDSVDVYRFGRRVDQQHGREYGFAYADLVNALRTALPSQVPFLVGRVAEIETGSERQSIVLADGRSVEARLVVVATGLGDAIRRKVGVTRVETSKAHSLSLGFSLDRPAGDYPFEALAYFGARHGDRVAYITLFPIGETMRANLFVYRDAGEAWTRRFRQTPREALLDLTPGLDEACGGIGIAGRVQVRPIDLTVSEGHRRDGFVLLGDAFCTTCPAPGVGIRRVLTDVDRLCNVHLPRWLETPGMGAEKIAAFYDDPVKVAKDAEAMRLSHFSRSMATDPGPIWAARRLRNDIARRGMARMRDVAASLTHLSAGLGSLLGI